MKVTVLSARKKFFLGESREVVLPGEEGELSVWDFHQPCIVRLKAGQVKIRIGEGHEQYQKIPIRCGVLRVDLAGLSVLVEEPLEQPK